MGIIQLHNMFLKLNRNYGLETTAMRLVFIVLSSTSSVLTELNSEVDVSKKFLLKTIKIIFLSMNCKPFATVMFI